MNKKYIEKYKSHFLDFSFHFGDKTDCGPSAFRELWENSKKYKVKVSRNIMCNTR